MHLHVAYTKYKKWLHFTQMHAAHAVDLQNILKGLNCFL